MSRKLQTEISHRIDEQGYLILPYDMSLVDCEQFLDEYLPYEVKIKIDYPVREDYREENIKKIIKDNVFGIWYSSYRRISDVEGILVYRFEKRNEAMFFKLKVT